jgi:acetyl esterase
MTKSMPGDAVSTGSAVPVQHPLAGRPSRRRLRLLAALSGVGLRVMPKIPEAVRRLLLGGRRVTIDGNTLDTRLQFMLTAQRLSGTGGLVASSNIDDARDVLRRLSAHLRSGVQVDTRDIRIPGPGGASIPARHYRPPVGPGAPLLVFFHGGGFVIGDLESHDELCRLI